jgi:hypothetical protein
MNKQFCNSEPSVVFKNEQGAEYIPIWAIEDDLDTLDESWHKREHKWEYSKCGNYLSTSIVVVVFGRTLCGASYIRITDYPSEQNIMAVGISEAIKNAVKVLGKRFGRELNDRRSQGDTQPITKNEKQEIVKAVKERERLKKLIENARTLEDLAKYKEKLTDYPELNTTYMDKVKSFANNIQKP